VDVDVIAFVGEGLAVSVCVGESGVGVLIIKDGPGVKVAGSAANPDEPKQLTSSKDGNRHNGRSLNIE
jgi:hypothetical protein